MSNPGGYKQLSEELEIIVEKLQSNNLDVDQTINEYQRGVEIINQLEKYLKTAQNKISKISQKNLITKK